MAIQLHSSFAVHPGPWLRTEFVQPYGLSVAETATKLGVTRPAMSNFLNGKAALSGTMALRFEKAFGIPADTLMRMQSAHDLVEARKGEGALKIERLPEPA